MLHEKASDHGTWNRGRYQVAQSSSNKLFVPLYTSVNYEITFKSSRVTHHVSTELVADRFLVYRVEDVKM